MYIIFQHQGVTEGSGGRRCCRYCFHDFGLLSPSPGFRHNICQLTSTKLKHPFQSIIEFSLNNKNFVRFLDLLQLTQPALLFQSQWEWT